MQASDPQRPATVAVGKSPTRIALARLRQDRVAMTSGGIVAGFVLIAVFAPVLAWLEGQSPTTFHMELVDQYGFPIIGPTTDHWFGVEPRLGRDLFARWVYGARPSLIVAGTVTLVTTLIGVIGRAGGRLPRWLGRPGHLLGHRLRAQPAVPAVRDRDLGGPGLHLRRHERSDARRRRPDPVHLPDLSCSSFFGWASLARLIRGQVLSLREREFISAAKVLGVPTRQVLFKELLPNLVAPIVISATLALPAYIVAEAGLTFLGVGLVEPTPSWGVTIAAARTFYRADPLYLWLPVSASRSSCSR